MKQEELLVVSPYRPWGASYRVRVGHWLERTGSSATYLAPGRRDTGSRARRFSPGDARYEFFVRFNARPPIDTLLIQKEASRAGSGGIERRLAEKSQFLIYDVDDAVFLSSASRRGRKRAKRVRSILDGSDRVIAGNQFLADYCSSFCRDVVVIPTCVEPLNYRRDERPAERRAVVIGWIGSATTEQYLAPVMPLISRLQVDHEIEVRIIGSGRSGPDQLFGCPVERRQWSLRTEPDELAQIDIGLAPLPDSPWERGKCAYKLLQYGAAGIAAVGSPVGVATEILSRGGAPAPTSESEWVEALRFLIESRDDRAKIADRLRVHVTENFSYDRWEPEWVGATIDRGDSGGLGAAVG